jgi:hypothetical protein
VTAATTTEADPSPGPALALTLALGIAGFAVVLATTELLVEPRQLHPPFDLGENQPVETALYLTGFLAILPLALVVGLRLARRPGLAALLSAAAAAAVLVNRALGSEPGVVLAVWAGWWLLAAAAIAARPRLPERAVWWAAGCLAMLALLAFTELGSIDLLGLVVAALTAAGLIAAHNRFELARWGLTVDAAVVLLLFALVPDLALYDPVDSFATYVAKTHQNFLLGPANIVMQGGALLVDAASQYGVGSVYFLNGWFVVAPLGYGALGLLGALLMVLLLAAGFALLRVCGAPRTLAVGVVALAVVALVYNVTYPIGSLPQEGPLRFGLPLLLILAAAVGERWPERRRAASAAELAVLGLASVWSFEAFAVTGVTWAAIVACRSWSGSERRRTRTAALALASVVAAQLLLILLTLVLAGELPDYGWYLAFVNEFLFGETGDITYDFARWSPGIPIGVGYAASVAALLVALRLRPELPRREPVVFIALAGCSAYGAVLFGYLVDRSLNEIVPYVSFPLVLLGALWVTLLGGRAPRAALALPLAAAVLVVGGAWSSVPERFGDSPFARAAPGGEPLSADLRRLWHLPPTDARVPQGEQLVQRWFPGGGKTLTLVAPALEAEILIRRERVNALPFSYPPQDTFISGERKPALRRAIEGLRPGDRLLTQAGALRPRGERLAPLQRWALGEIRRRFRLRVLHRDLQGYVVAELTS